MTEHTADDFEHARFATHPDGRVAARIGRDLPWVMPCIENCESVGLECNGLDHAPASFMANEGWTPVREQPRPLTPDAIEVALHDCMPGVAFDRLSGTQVMRLAEDMHAALTEPPARPEGAEDIEALIHEYKRENAHRGYSEAEIADYVAARLTDPTRKEHS